MISTTDAMWKEFMKETHHPYSSLVNLKEIANQFSKVDTSIRDKVKSQLAAIPNQQESSVVRSRVTR